METNSTKSDDADKHEYYCSYIPSISKFPFDVIVVTSPNERAAKAALSGPLKSLSSLLSKSHPFDTNKGDNNSDASYDEVLILSTNDPFDTKMGSGGGTIAALAYADLKWKERQNEKAKLSRETATTKDLMSYPSVLIIHAGGDSSRCPTQMALGKAWTSLPVSSTPTSSAVSSSCSTIITPTLMLVTTLSNVFSDLPKSSVIVACSDVLTSMPINAKCDFKSYVKTNGSNMVVGLAVPAPLQVATNHGVFVVSQDDESEGDMKHNSYISPLLKYLQKPSVSEMKKEPLCCFSSSLDERENSSNYALIDSGVVTFLPLAAKIFRELAQTPTGPLFRCTQKGLETLYNQSHQQQHVQNQKENIQTFAKQNTIQIELYTHIMLALSTSNQTTKSTKPTAPTPSDKEVYMNKVLEKPGKPQIETFNFHDILSHLYDFLSKISFHVWIVDNGQFCHLGTTRELIDLLTLGNCCRLEDKKKIRLCAEEAQKGAKHNYVQRRCEQFGEQCQLVGRANAYLGRKVHAHFSSVVLNTILSVSDESRKDTATSHPKEFKNSVSVGPMSVLEHCYILSSMRNELRIGKNCLLSGIRGSFSKPIIIPDGICLQILPLLSNYQSEYEEDSVKEYVCMILHVDDDIKKSQTILGVDITRFLQVTGLQMIDIWPKLLNASERKVWNGKFHPTFQFSTEKDDLKKTKDDENSSMSSLVGSRFDMDLSLIFTWITEMIQNPNLRHEDELSPEGKQSLHRWKETRKISLQSIRASSDALVEFQYRHNLEEHILRKNVETLDNVFSTLSQNRNSPCVVEPFIDSFLGGSGHNLELLWKRIDNIALSAVSVGRSDITSQCLMVMSLMMADISKALGSSLDSDESTTLPDKVHQSLKFDINSIRMRKGTAVKELFELCYNVFSTSLHWMPPQSYSESFLLCSSFMKLALMFEQAAAVLIEACVGTMEIKKNRERKPRKDVKTFVTSGKWVIASAPARIDLSGGWSDTPPISFKGGSVLNMAVKVDSRRPFSARCRITNAGIGGLHLVTEMRSAKNGDLIDKQSVHVKYVEDLLDFRDPVSTAALLKAALISLNLLPQQLINDSQMTVEKMKKTPIQPYLNSFLFAKEEERLTLELVSTSLLPRGSGLGGSSILGGCVISSIGRCIGYDIISDGNVSANTSSTNIETINLSHAVLVLEQLMTTGGGWQDQIGGLVGGVKLARSKPNKFPMEIEVKKIPLSITSQIDLNDRVVLVFTGKPRLAKNLLQNVLRSWARRTDKIVKTVDSLVTGAENAAICLAEGDIDKAGEFLLNYWELKKTMVGENGGAEPKSVYSLLSFLLKKQCIVGGSLCGAGGGGFMTLIARKGLVGKDLEKIVASEGDDYLKEINKNDFSWHACDVCEKGLKTEILNYGAGIETFELAWHS